MIGLQLKTLSRNIPVELFTLYMPKPRPALPSPFGCSAVPHHLRSLAVYKSGTGTRGWGHRDACVGTWDLGMSDEGLEDIKYGTRGRGDGDTGTSNTGT